MKRLRKLLLFIVVLGLLAGGLLVFAMYNANSLVQAYKPELEQKLSETVGSTVTLGTLGVSLFPSTRLTVDEVTIASTSSPDEQLTLANAALHLDLLPLLKRRLKITSLSLTKPSITLVKDENGIHIAGLPDSPPPEDETTTPEVSTAEVSTAEVPIDLALDEFKLRNGTILLKNTTTDTEYALKDLSIDASMKFEDDRLIFPTMKGSGTALDKSALKLDGKDIQYDLDSGIIRIAKLDATSDGNTITLAGVLDSEDPEQSIKLTSDGVELAKLEPWFDTFAPDLLGLELKGIATPDITISPNKDGDYEAVGTIVLAKASALLIDNRLTNIAGSFDLKADADRQHFSGKGLNARYSDAPLKIDMDLLVRDGKATLSPAHLEGFGGTADATGTIALEGDMPFSSTYTFTDMQVSELIAAFLPDVPLELTGVLRSFTAKIDGDLGETFTATITGDGASALVGGVLKDINIADKVLSAVDGIPFVSGALVSLVPEDWQGYLEQKYTVVESLEGTFTVSNEIITTDDLYLTSDFFDIAAKGTVGFDTVVDLDSTIFFSEAFSTGLLEKADELAILLNDKGQLTFPVRITGQAPDLKVFPDVKALLTDNVKKTIVDEASKALQNLLSPSDDEEEGEKAKPLENLRNRLFKRKEKP